MKIIVFLCHRQESSNNIICPLVFAGPSGVGKGTIINLLMKKYPNLFGFSTSHTTRKPRYYLIVLYTYSVAPIFIETLSL